MKKPTKLRPSQGGKMHGPVAAGTAEERVFAEEWETKNGGLYVQSRLEHASYLGAHGAFEHSRRHAPTRAPVDIRATEYHRSAGELARGSETVTGLVIRVTPSSFLDVWRENDGRNDIMLRGASGQWCLRIDAASIIRHPDGNAAYALLQVADVTSNKLATISIYGATDVMIGRKPPRSACRHRRTRLSASSAGPAK